MARAMRASGDLKPKAMRVMRRVLVFMVIWRRALGGEDCGAVLEDAFPQFHERWDAAAPGPTNPFVEGLDGFYEWQFEDDAEAFLQVVSACQPGVGLHYPRHLHLLLLGQVSGFFQRV